ncbi:nucleotidyltransferase domain-containing protein [Candidatus Pacearchaeota archaeon]|nr:nucleotidyltransferase domain-containing protein [Candidatus Pacearchaeota archaeon]
MINKANKQEQLIRKVSQVGNGAHVFAPREWLGEEVIIIRSPAKSFEEKVLEILNPYLANIKGVYVYGSHSRNEATKNSDIDLLLIVDKKINLKKQGYEVIALQEKDIRKAISLAPILIYSAFAEAKPLINSELLSKLKEKYKINLKYFKLYIKETKKIIKINEEILDYYSIMLRLRGVYIIHCLLNKIPYSNKKFMLWLSNNIPEVDADILYSHYSLLKRNLKIPNIKEEDLIVLLDLLKSKINEVENLINGKKKKEA